MFNHLDPDYVISTCMWKPTSGKLYKCLDPNGFFINDKPISTYEARAGFTGYGGVRSINYLKYDSIFMYIGGPGGQQRCPNHYTAFRILFGEQIKWLIYPERWRYRERAPIPPIRL